MKIKRIYLDMDGVLTDFEKRYVEMFGQNPLGEDRANKEKSKNWDQFVETRQFESLEWFPGGKKLLDYLQSLNIPMEILSSTGGPKYHSNVREQKYIWLNDNNVWLNNENIVPGRRIKRFFSFSGHILIDDTEDVVEEFNQYGGKAILHKSAEKTIEALETLLNK